MNEPINSKAIKRKQLLNIAVLVAIVLIVFTGFIYMISDNDDVKITSHEQKLDFASPLSHVDAESVILEQTQKKLKEADNRSTHLQEEIDALMKDKNESADKSTEELKNRIEALEQQLSSTQQNKVAIPNTTNLMNGSQEYQGNFVAPAQGNQDSSGINNETLMEQTIREDTLTLSPKKNRYELRIPSKNPDSYVPSGTFVKAVMIGGADASAAVNAQANPTPMLFRIVENGTLPNHHKSHLKDCVVTAAVVGDISSERGMIRLENLSCTLPNREIVDQAVEGTIFGSEGKNGVRGRPVWREGALLQRAFAAGALSGISDGLSQTYTTNSISPQGNVATIDPSKIAQVGLSKGVGKAMDKLADYNIQRAEQYHPVIQLSAGSVVDVVFLKGFFLDGKKHDERQDEIVSGYNSSIQTQGEPSYFSGMSENTTLPLSPDAVKRIQEHSKELGLRVNS